MARISNTTVYPVDTNIEGNDRLLGTDANSNSPLATRSYTIDGLADYIGAGTNLLRQVPPQWIPVIHEHSNTDSENRVEIGPIKLNKISVNETITLDNTMTGNVSEFYLNSIF